APAAAAPSAPVQDRLPVPERSSSSVMQTVGFAVSGTGVANLAIAGVFFAMRQNASSNLACGAGGPGCPNDANRAADAQTYGAISAAAFIGGVGMLAIGGMLVIAAPSSRASSTGGDKGAFGAWDIRPGAGGAPGATIRAEF